MSIMERFHRIKRFIESLFFNNNNNQLEEPVITYSVGNKRNHDENLNDDLFIKKKKLSSGSQEDIIHIDLTDSPIDTISLHTMPKPKRNKKSKRTDRKKNDCTEIIEVIDDDSSESKSNDVEIVEDISNKRNLRKNALSSSLNSNVKEFPSSKYDDAREASKGRSYLSFSSIGQLPPSFNFKLKPENRTLKELNRSDVNNGCPSDTFKKDVVPTSSTSSSRFATRRAFHDSLMMSSLNKVRNRDTFLNLMKKYATSPKTNRLSASRNSSVSTRSSSSSLNSSASDRTFGTFPSQSSNLSMNLKKSNQTAESPSNRRYSTRFQNSFSNSRSPTIKPRSPSTSSNALNTPAISKTVIDLTSEEDDECQRQEIISNVVSSEYIRNLKTSFVGSNKSIAESDYIHNILKKYEANMRANEFKAQKFREQIRERRSDFNKTISEIFEKRLSIKEHEVEEEPKPAFELAPITKAMTDAINQLVASKKVPLVQIKDTSVKLQDIRTLENCAWLNDEIINAYMNLIKMRAEKKPDKYPKVHCFNTFLYEQLQKKGYNSVRRWTKKIDIFDFNILIIPIHLGNHWCLIQIKIKEKCIRYFDSMGSPNNLCLKSMMQYLVDEYKDKKNGDLDASKWELINMPPNEIPQQKNMHDCGVFACTFAEHLTRQAPLNFSQENMTYFRLKMMYEILIGELLL